MFTVWSDHSEMIPSTRQRKVNTANGVIKTGEIINVRAIFFPNSKTYTVLSKQFCFDNPMRFALYY
jgi:hypothetical protein